MVSAQALAPPAVEDRCTAELWDAYVDRHEAATLYHQHAFRTVFERAFGHRCHYLAATRGGRVAGVLPLVEFDSRLFGRFAVSLPFVNYGGVLADDEATAASLVDRAVGLASTSRWRHVELRHRRRICPAWPARSHKVLMERPLESTPEALWSAVDRKVRNLVRKAEKSGCVASSGGPELLPEFYRVFARNMRDLGTPVYTPRFFSEVLAATEGRSRVFVVRRDGSAVAASIVLHWRDRAEVPWASSLRTHASSSPNMLLYWAMLKWAVGERLRVFDFGRSTPGEGTYHFKTQWGALARPSIWEYAGLSGEVPNQGPSNPKFRAAIAIWKRLPLAVANALGPAIVRNIP
jgi:FemAB-related protein (PEP-CTERM system-associated)